MRIYLYGALILVVAVVAGLVFLPTAYVMVQVSKQEPSIYYSRASGSVWNGQVRSLRYGVQPLGDLSFEANPMSLLTGQLASSTRLSGGALSGRGLVETSLGGTFQLEQLSLTGTTDGLISLIPDIRDLNGEFNLVLREARFRDNECLEANGQVWTDILTRIEQGWGWAGPELEGPISCENGDLLMQLQGETTDGEAVNVRLLAGMDASGEFEARVTNAMPDTSRALTALGFLAEGDNDLIYRHVLSTEGSE